MKCPALRRHPREPRFPSAPRERRFLSAFALCALACLTGAGCSLFKKDKPGEDAPLTLVIGTVRMVNPEQEYVLIRCEQLYNLAPGTEVTAVSPQGQAARLKLTPERKGWFWTADIVEGRPETGNLVYFRKNGGALPKAPGQPPAPVSMSAPGLPQPAPLGMPSLPGLPEGFEVPQNLEPLPADAP